MIVDAADPTHVTFTISGLEGDESGTMTFTDSIGHSDVVPVGSNGTYSANLSNLANGTLTYLVSVTDPVGNVTTFDPTVTLGDGSANAPAGTPQLPNLFVGEAIGRLGWLRESIMQSVFRPDTVLRDWQNLSGPGISVVNYGGQWFVRVDNTGGAVISGVDFSLHGGADLMFVNSPNGVVTDCNFKSVSGIPIQTDANSPGLTVKESPSLTEVVRTVRVRLFRYWLVGTSPYNMTCFKIFRSTSSR